MLKQLSKKNLGFFTQWCTNIGLHMYTEKEPENILRRQIDSVMGDIKVLKNDHEVGE